MTQLQTCSVTVFGVNHMGPIGVFMRRRVALLLLNHSVRRHRGKKSHLMIENIIACSIFCNIYARISFKSHRLAAVRQYLAPAERHGMDRYATVRVPTVPVVHR